MKKELYKDNPTFKLDSSMIMLILSNLVPIYGVFFWNWNLFNILILYWLESGVIGFFTIFKILLSRRDFTLKNGIVIKMNPVLMAIFKVFIVFFFVFHFSIFMFGHLMFIYLISTLTKYSIQPLNLAMMLLLYAIIFLISHGLSFINNYILKKEYLKINPIQAMNSPYYRILVMHLTILLGTFLFAISGVPRVGSTLIIILKTILDLYFHNIEHKKLKIQNL